MTQLTLKLPEYVLQNAQKKGLLDDDALTAMLRNHMEYRKNHPHPVLKKSASKITSVELENLIRAEVAAVLNLNKQNKQLP